MTPIEALEKSPAALMEGRRNCILGAESGTQLKKTLLISANITLELDWSSRLDDSKTRSDIHRYTFD